MIKRTLFISNAVCLSTKNKQLIVYNKDTKEENQVPIEDVGFVIIENNQVSITIPLINLLAENNAFVIFCNEKHLPYTMNIPIDFNYTQSQTFNNQLSAKLPVKKQCWKQIIESKVKNQALLLKKYQFNYERLEEYSHQVKSGDSTHVEAIAAKLYWNELFEKSWKRERDGIYPNNYFNYGYAVLRAAMARAIVGSGMLPIMGLFHHGKYDAYCLADDLMEPYRPYVDDEVLDYISKNPEEKEITIDYKKNILNLLTRDVSIDKLTRPFMIGLTMTTSSLAKVFAGEQENLSLPVFI